MSKAISCPSNSTLLESVFLTQRNLPVTSKAASLPTECSVGDPNLKFRRCRNTAQALSSGKPSTKACRKLSKKRLNPSEMVIKSTTKSNSTHTISENTSSHRPQVVTNATPVGMEAASGLQLLPTINDGASSGEEGSPKAGKYTDKSLLTQVLIGKKKVVVKTKRADKVAEESTALESLKENAKGSATDDYQTLLVNLIDQLQGIRLQALALERWHAPQLKKIHRRHRESARNLLHYAAFRSLDIAGLQESLSTFGLSSLGSCEAHTMASVTSVISLLRSLLQSSQMDTSRFGVESENGVSGSSPILEPDANGCKNENSTAVGTSDDTRGALGRDHTSTWTSELSLDILQNSSPELSFQSGNSTLSHNAELLLGPSPLGRKAQIMVTLPSEAAEDDVLIRKLFKAGMNIARVNCAHDSPEVWKKMIQKVRFFSQLLETPCRILMDLAGPKLRTGAMRPGPSVLKIKPSKDSLGDVVTPACVWLANDGTKPSVERVPDACIPIVAGPRWVKKIEAGDVIKFKDGRGHARELHVVGKGSGASKAGVWAECGRTSYLGSGTELHVAAHGGKKLKMKVGQLPEVEQAIVLKSGDKLVLKRDSILGIPARVNKAGKIVAPAQVACTLGQVFDAAKLGEPVKFDDGKIGGVISRVSPTEITVDIVEAGDHKGRKLRGEKAINLPKSDVSVCGLTVKDTGDLDFVVANADIVALSFVNGPADVRVLQDELARRGAEKLGIVLKIETELGFQNLPAILLQAMERMNPLGVMVARGDMAVECGWQRLAEIQDQILLICEASHVPTIWATQVLEDLAKSGLPSRAEITDAASGSRAECVMLNKGPYIVQAVSSLADILRREACHRRKNESVLHPLPHLQSLRTYTQKNSSA